MCKNNRNCNCDNVGMVLSKYKGEKGDTGLTGTPGLNGTNGTNGISVVSIQNNGLGYIYTFSDGSTTAVGYPFIGSFYQAWADDATGTGFTLTPSDKKYTAMITSIAGGSPVASDFTGSYFLINQPVKEFIESNEINTSILLAPVVASTLYTFPSPIPLTSIPITFINGNKSVSKSYFEIDVQMNERSSNLSFELDIAGTKRIFDLVDQAVGNVKIKGELTTTCLSNGALVSTGMFFQETIPDGPTTYNFGFINQTLVSAGVVTGLSNLDIKLTGIISTSASFIDDESLRVRRSTVSAYNPVKTTM